MPQYIVVLGWRVDRVETFDTPHLWRERLVMPESPCDLGA